MLHTGTVNNNYNGTATSTTTWQYEYPTTVICPYKDKCSSKGYKCGSCKRNEYKDYYLPDYYIPNVNWGTVQYDNTTTVIDGGKIYSSSIASNQISSGKLKIGTT